MINIINSDHCVNKTNTSPSPINNTVNNTVNNIKSDNMGSLMWITAHLNNQQALPVMIDTGATPNCLALRCVQASIYLKNLPRQEYFGSGVLAANGHNLRPSFIINTSISLGSPPLHIQTQFLVIDSLPYSCILGQCVLQNLSVWSVSNVTRTITMNQSQIPFTAMPMYDLTPLNLLTTTKCALSPGKVIAINTRATGSLMSPFRSVSNPLVLAKGNVLLTSRLKIEVVPAVTLLTHENCHVKILAYNVPDQIQYLSKGAKVACCSMDFETLSQDVMSHDYVNAIDPCTTSSELDSLEYLCKGFKSLTSSEYAQARELLRSYQAIFSIGSSKIGKTNIQELDIDVDSLPRVSVPLRRVPLQHQQTVVKLIDKYMQLGLLEPTDSPFRAATVLVQKKNVAAGVDVTDHY